MLPIEILSLIGSVSEPVTSRSLLSTSKGIRNGIRTYSPFLYSMTKEQKRIYDTLLTTNEKRIDIKTLPGNGSSIILLNYINECLKKDERVILLTETLTWKDVLEDYFLESFLFIQNKDERIPKDSLFNKRILMTTSSLKEEMIRNYAPSIIISCDFYNYLDILPTRESLLFANLKKCILSSHRLMSKRQHSIIKEIYHKNILPFSSYSSFLLVSHSPLHIFSSILREISQFTLMGGDAEDIEILRMQRVRVFTEESAEEFHKIEGNTKAALVYTKKFLRKNAPFISGVIVINTIDGGSPHKALDYLFDETTYVPVLLSSKITHLYYYSVDEMLIDQNSYSYRLPAAILLQETHIRMCLAGFTLDPFLDFMEICYTEYRNYGKEYNAELVKEDDEPFYRWNSRDWIQRIYPLYTQEYSEKTHILDLIK